ncbi:hypothetical protein J4772_11585 [Cohnella sp. LGH]|uniref:hypothetical protein n=1 Tax=Cohnella sp. LGH TaxID=1619153 RepID=UPI001ADC8C0D|nr:hypothetical protein [Cohnella sp. LGH]QTH44980.1 hypothetical protein J4772_11585 [Cohnella sp. LGH]
MKKWTKKVWMSAGAVLIAIMSVSAIPVSADVSRVQYFTIQNNTACDSSIRLTGLYFNVNNISNSSVQATLYLYKNDGTLFTSPGITTSTGFSSTLTPGTSFTIDPYSTKQYASAFGGQTNGTTVTTNLPCTDRPAYGKIVVESDTGLIMANGEIVGSDKIDPNNTNRNIYQNTGISINEGKPF